jgi:hypothetical protein
MKKEAAAVNWLREAGTCGNIIQVLNAGRLKGDQLQYFFNMELSKFTLSAYLDYVFPHHGKGKPLPDIDLSNKQAPILIY